MELGADKSPCILKRFTFLSSIYGVWSSEKIIFSLLLSYTLSNKLS